VPIVRVEGDLSGLWHEVAVPPRRADRRGAAAAAVSTLRAARGEAAAREEWVEKSARESIAKLCASTPALIRPAGLQPRPTAALMLDHLFSLRLHPPRFHEPQRAGRRMSVSFLEVPIVRYLNITLQLH
jgi:hypothetical protein